MTIGVPATIAEIDDATTAGTNKFTYSGGWTANGAVTGATNSTTHSTSTAGSTATIDWSGTALYIILGTGLGRVSVATDGSSTNPELSGYSSNAGASRIVLPLARKLTNGVHQTILTTLDASPVVIDGAFVMSGAKGTPTTGVLACLGDSWTNKQGATNSGIVTSYINQLRNHLNLALNRPITLNNLGVAGDKWRGSSTTVLIGGLYRLVTQAFPTCPEFLTMLFGLNDFNNNGGLFDYTQDNITALSLIEDALDTSQVTVALGTVGYVGSFARVYNPSTAKIAAGTLSLYEASVNEVYQAAQLFSWAQIADIFAKMDYRNELVSQNSSAGDFGLHPNDLGHSVIALEFKRALLKVNG